MFEAERAATTEPFQDKSGDSQPTSWWRHVSGLAAATGVPARDGRPGARRHQLPVRRGLPHYASGPAPVRFGADYVTLTEWRRTGLAAAIDGIVIWRGVGALWLKVLGHW
ncbi:anion permease [Streptomyces blattellae]|uniref:anion permease n=1 Tax=Streptomyces blattellae TaxID=2569855 RepID=UPI0012B7008A|nr:anion permease [Streptomyces blattellae]